MCVLFKNGTMVQGGQKRRSIELTSLHRSTLSDPVVDAMIACEEMRLYILGRILCV
jgi:hypothetical protein